MFHILLFSSSLWSTQDASHVFKVTQKHDCGFLRKKQCCYSYKLTEHLNLTPLQGHKLGHHFLSFVTPTTTLLTCIKHGEKRYDQNYGSFLCNLEHINHSKKKKNLRVYARWELLQKGSGTYKFATFIYGHGVLNNNSLILGMWHWLQKTKW